MAAFNFPNSPSVNDTYSANGMTFTWNGTKWERTSPSVGAQGATGPTGAQGTAGAQGATAAQGAQGATGSTGNTGAQGAAGSNGSAGAQGATGSGGSTGAQGAAGAQGATGSGGSTGSQGATGSTGPTGPTGAQGATGSGGSTGAQGATGSGGSTGPTGAQGATGSTGAQGAGGLTTTNADTVDSLHAASFLRSDANDTLTKGSQTIFSGGWNDWLVRFSNNNGSNANVYMCHHDHGMHIRNDSSTTSTYLLDVYGSTGNRFQVRGSDARTTLTGTYLLQTGLIHFDVKLTSGGSSGTLVFNSVLENVGNGYNSSNGRFTAPVAGVYVFTGAILQSNSGSQFDVNIRYNGATTNKGASMRAQFTGHSTIQVSETLKLNANDYVDIYVSSSNVHIGGSGNWVGWQGTLLG